MGHYLSDLPSLDDVVTLASAMFDFLPPCLLVCESSSSHRLRHIQCRAFKQDPSGLFHFCSRFRHPGYVWKYSINAGVMAHGTPHAATSIFVVKEILMEI
jgi:hypothetical protein